MKESEIRPEAIFKEYLRLSAEDARTLFDPATYRGAACPGCGGQVQHPYFEKNGFSYQICDGCGSQFVSPRPPLDSFEKLYSNSKSATFWSREFFPAVLEARREKIFQPRVARVAQWANAKGFKPQNVLEVGAGHGLFLEEWKKLRPETHLFAVEPSADMAQICRAKGIDVEETVAEEATRLRQSADLTLCFEVIEHAHDTLRFVRSIHDLTRPGGYALLTGLGGDGFDVLTLGAKSNSYAPPHHLNFLTREGFEQLFRRAGFEDVVIETPGKLDVDIVRNIAKSDPSALEGNLFVQTLLRRSDACLEEFQTFLQRHQLSSHVWIWGRRPQKVRAQ